MSIYIDRKYINLVSNMIPKFKWKKDNLANCRCFICGDSTKSKSKARGYFFVKNNNFFYKCHNCGVGLSVYNFLQQIAPSLCREYSLERYISGDNRGNYKKPSTEEIYPFEATKPTSYSFQYLSDLPKDHKAVKYVQARLIPESKWEDIAYTDDVSKLAEEFDEAYKNKFSKEDRLVVVIRSNDGICGFQCRSFKAGSKSGIKYITLKDKANLCYYGMNKIDFSKKFYILEGPINSMFIDNAMATLGSSNFLLIDQKLDDTNGVYVIDNEPYKQETVDILEKLIESGKTVCIFPKNIIQKDINDMVKAGFDPQKIIDENTCSGLKAKFLFNQWKKI